MKKLALISSYCDTEEKIQVLKNTLLRLKELEVDSLLFTPINLDKEIYSLTTHTLISSENPILKAPERTFTNWIWSIFKGFKIKNVILTEDYGWASLNQLKRLAQFGSNLDYDIYYLLIYDLNFTPEIKDIITSNKVNSFFPNKHSNTTSHFKLGAIFSCFSKENLNLFGKVLNKSNYVKYKTAELYLEDLNKTVLNFPISNIVTEDLIYNDGNLKNYHNVSPSTNLKVFINNYRYLGVNFYDVEAPTKIDIKINNEVFSKQIDSHTIFLSPLPLENINSLSLVFNGIEEDFTNFLPQNINTRFEIKIDEKTSLDYIKNFVHSHNINFN